MSTIEITWSNNELRRTRCFECVWLKMMPDEFIGTCTLPETKYFKIRERNRTILTRKCTRKQLKPIEEVTRPNSRTT